MTHKINLTFPELKARARALPVAQDAKVYGVPRGGVYAAMVLLGCRHDQMQLVEKPAEADCFIDDIIDSGATRGRFANQFPGKPFYALVDKQGRDSNTNGSWISFPWERLTNDDGPQENIRRILEFIGEKPHREGLRETPDRVVRSYAELFAGYKQDPAELLKTFDGENYDECIVVKGIEFTSFCEHHMLPFDGVAHVGYIPDGRIVGLSKVARLVDLFAKRLQVQERLTTDITSALMEYLKPKGAACVVYAKHSCMGCRGAKKPTARMGTSSLLGVFREKPEARAEFFSLIRG